MISAKKIRTLKPRVQLRRSADVFHEAAAADPGKEYLDEVMAIILASDILSPEDKERIRRFYEKGDSLSYEDIHYHLLSALGDVPTEWDATDEAGNIDWSRRSILPHYLFHIDPVRGAAHFATGMKKGLEIMEYFRKHLSSVATPIFALDLPEGGGKVHLFPDYSTGEPQVFRSLDGRKIRHPLA